MNKFILGAIVALMVCAQSMNAQERRGGSRQMNPEQMMESRMKMLDKELDLTKEQEVKIRSIYQEYFGKQPRERGDRMEMRKKMEEMNNKIKAELTKTQKKKFDNMNKNRIRRGPGGERRPDRGPR